MIKVEKLVVSAEKFSLQSVSLEIPEGLCASVMGKSGSGKSTLMEAICGLRHIREGSIILAGNDITYAAPASRQVGFVPQENVLFPTMSVRAQIAYGPKIRKWTNDAIEKRVAELADQLGIAQLLDRKPKNLSGGEAKRVAIARALASKPKLLCLDESFTGLDDETQMEVLKVVKRTIQAEKITTLLITHQQSVADFLAAKQYKMEEGKLRNSEF